jgi:hypothetical protein
MAALVNTLNFLCVAIIVQKKKNLSTDRLVLGTIKYGRTCNLLSGAYT